MRYWFISGLVLTAIAWGSTTGQQQETDHTNQVESSGYMKRKLDYAREIVSGLAMEDYDRISHAARELALISQESIWNAVTTEPYLRESSNFRASAARLQEMAKAKNLDGSALAYFEVTLNCVRCHQYLRTAQRADQDE
jgi:hypothetical protein